MQSRTASAAGQPGQLGRQADSVSGSHYPYSTHGGHKHGQVYIRPPRNVLTESKNSSVQQCSFNYRVFARTSSLLRSTLAESLRRPCSSVYIRGFMAGRHAIPCVDLSGTAALASPGQPWPVLANIHSVCYIFCASCTVCNMLYIVHTNHSE